MKNILKNITEILIIILLVLGFKSYNLYKFSIEKININKSEDIFVAYNNIKSNRSIEKLNFYLDDKYISNDNGITYTDGKHIIKVSVKNNILKNISYNDNKLLPTDYLNILNNNSINNEIGLINYYMNNDINIFSFINKMKTNYLATLLIKEMNIKDNINFIEGLDGVLYKDNIETKVFIFKNRNMYTISFNKEFNDNEIKDIINSFNFE